MTFRSETSVAILGGSFLFHHDSVRIGTTDGIGKREIGAIKISLE